MSRQKLLLPFVPPTFLSMGRIGTSTGLPVSYANVCRSLQHFRTPSSYLLFDFHHLVDVASTSIGITYLLLAFPWAPFLHVHYTCDTFRSCF